MFDHKTRPAYLAAGLLLALGTGAAQASVLGATATTNFADTPASITFGSADQAGYTFSPYLLNPSLGEGGGVVPGVSTQGSAQVSVSPLEDTVANAFPEGLSLSGDSYFGTPYAAQPDTAETLLTADYPYLGLAFTLEDGIHYGYAEIEDMTLTRYAYESDPGAAITTGAAIEGDLPSSGVNPVPSPASWGMFGLGALLIGAGTLRRRRMA